jgi:hypothetical protein
VALALGRRSCENRLSQPTMHALRPNVAVQLAAALAALAVSCGGAETFDQEALLESVERVGSEAAACPDYLGAPAEGETQHCFRTALSPDDYVKRLVNALPAPDGFDLETGFDWRRDTDVRLQGGCIADVIDSSVPYPYAGGEALFGVVDRRRCDDGVWVVMYTAPTPVD